MLHDWFVELNPARAEAETDQRVDALRAATLAVVALDGDEVVGVAGLGELWLDAELTAGLAHPAEVFSVYVARHRIGEGVGQSMLDVIEDTARAHGVTDLLAISGVRHKQIGYPFWNRRYGPPVRVDDDYWAEGAERVVWRMSLG